MARTDIAGLLTGVPSGGIDPMAVGGTPAQQRLAFGAQRAQGLQRASRGLMGQDTRTPSEQLQMAMAQLDMSNPDDLRKIAQIQQATGDLAGAAQTAARIKQMQEQEQKLTAKAGLIDATKTAITEKYGDKRKDLLALADQGMSLQEVDSFAKIDANDRYKVVGNNVLDVTTGEYLPPPKGAGKEGFTVQKFYDAEKGANVVQFLDKADPTKVLREEIDTKDMGRQSATLLNLQAENLEMANEAGKQAREANAVANRLEKAAAEGMTGGVIAQGEEFIKSILGSEDEVTLLRKSADRLRVSRAVANLPVGPASDKDVALVLGGELSSTADPKTVAQYVRGIAKLAKAERDFYSTQNAWLDTYKGDIGGFSSYVQKEQLEKQLGHSSIVAAEKRLAEVNYDPAALAIFEQKFGFDYMDAKQKLDRANKTLATLKREDF
jgi:hypothetical protein